MLSGLDYALVDTCNTGFGLLFYFTVFFLRVMDSLGGFLFGGISCFLGLPAFLTGMLDSFFTDEF